MIGSYLLGAISRSPSLQQVSYRRVANNEANEEANEHLGPKIKMESIHPQKAHRRHWMVAGIILTLLILAAFLATEGLRAGANRASFSPTLKLQGVVFELDSLFAQPPSEESNAAWDSLIPDGHGYVLVPDAAEKYGLKAGISTGEGADRYSVALYHQIHCLGVIRIMFYEMVSFGNRTASLGQRQPIRLPESHGSETHTEHDPHDYNGDEGAGQTQDPIADHVEHCFDYLRQSIMCAGDLTIEHAREPPLGEKRETTDGWGVEHQCKSWDEMVNWTLDHKANHSLKGILG